MPRKNEIQTCRSCEVPPLDRRRPTYLAAFSPVTDDDASTPPNRPPLAPARYTPQPQDGTKGNGHKRHNFFSGKCHDGPVLVRMVPRWMPKADAVVHRPPSFHSLASVVMPYGGLTSTFHCQW
ncbi:hypothetical protein MKZ38_001717 [Zalerion maritima]|uniref:Uncharacterized protein n=1 Tax=Zalerion maritima TaxID=339359 RepID=A0AAD5RPZ8_9PEZI|nr:hypothetical protein MKZ38_001717 [Zalerion maritima]